MKKLLNVIEMFVIMIVVVISLIYISVEYQVEYFKYMQYSHVNYISLML